MPAIAERTYLQEWHFFFENTRRWRDLRKITIASVQGNAISAGLMLIWACDLIVAADDAKFSDVVAARMGMPGVEYYAHPWEFGARKAKELLLTGDSIDADEAHRLGVVSKVFPCPMICRLRWTLHPQCRPPGKSCPTVNARRMSRRCWARRRPRHEPAGSPR